MAKSLPNRFPLRKLHKKGTRKRDIERGLHQGRKAGRGRKSISRRGDT